jgi:molybdopterin/thiamine biosynthesis adenylyltransferase
VIQNFKPQIFKRKEELPNFLHLIDTYDSICRELFLIHNPFYYRRENTEEAGEAKKLFLAGIKPAEVWIFYPARQTVIRSVEERFYLEVRTARNRNVITKEEQKTYRDFIVGIVGLSVGSMVLSSLARTGGPKCMKIADFDTIELTNINRMNASLFDFGKPKILVAAENVWEIDPFAELLVWEDGVTAENIESFIAGDPRLDIFIDEMDNLHLKIIARQICKRDGIPVIMATSNGDGIIVDIERFDREPELAIFQGRINDINPAIINQLSFEEWLKIARRIVGEDLLVDRVKLSLKEIGKSIVAVPQLGTTTAVGGAVLSYIVRKLASCEDLKSGRYQFKIEIS